jgi:biopolymer transport protein ExbB/TolQ
MVDNILNYLNHIGVINIGVLIVLSIYLISTFWIFFYKFLSINNKINIENQFLNNLMMNKGHINPLSSIGNFINDKEISKELFEVYETNIIKEASSGLSILSIFASTSPFVGLFGTVVGILESFAKFSTLNKVGFSVIAPAISEALVATAAGIFVAIFAYAFHQLLTRKVYILNTIINSQIKIILSRKGGV